MQTRGQKVFSWLGLSIFLGSLLMGIYIWLHQNEIRQDLQYRTMQAMNGRKHPPTALPQVPDQQETSHE